MKTTILKYLAPAALLASLAMPLAAHADSPHNINARLHRQQQRIHQGVGGDQLTRREQYRLDARDARIRSQEYRDRLSGGRMTAREHRRIERELNHSSRAIYHQKHDWQHRH